MKRLCLLALILCLLALSAAAEAPAGEAVTLTIEDLCVFSFPPGSQALADPRGSEALAKKEHITIARYLVPGTSHDFLIELTAGPPALSPRLMGLSMASLTEEGMADLLFVPESSDLSLIQIFPDAGNGIAAGIYENSSDDFTQYFASTCIRGWALSLNVGVRLGSKSPQPECLDLLLQVLSDVQILEDHPEEGRVPVLDLFTLDRPAGWLFTEEYNEAYSTPDKDFYFLGVFLHEGAVIEIHGEPATRRSKRKDLADMTATEKEDYILDLTRQDNSAGIVTTYQYTAADNAASIPFLFFYSEPRDGSGGYYQAHTVYRGAHIEVFASTSLNRTDDFYLPDEMEALLATLRPPEGD